MKTSQGSWTAVATLLTVWPPGAGEAGNFFSSASSGIGKGSVEDIAEARVEEGLGGGRERLYRGLAGALELQPPRVEQHRPAAGPVDRVAGDRESDPGGGVDPYLVGPAGLGPEDDE